MARGNLPFVRLVAEDVEEQDLDPGIPENQVQPDEKRNQGERKRAVQVGIGGANQGYPCSLSTGEDRAHPGDQAAPILDQDVGKEPDQQRECRTDDPLADDRRHNVANRLHDPFDDGLASRGHELRTPHRQANGHDDAQGDHPAGHHAVGDRNAAHVEHVFRHLLARCMCRRGCKGKTEYRQARGETQWRWDHSRAAPIEDRREER